MTISFRPHHFLCALCFKGNGYSTDFVANFKAIMAILNGKDGDKTPIQVRVHTDSICAPCPHRNQDYCHTEEKIQGLDNAHANALAITPGEAITWEDAKNRIREHVSLEKFHEICAGCSWKRYGICESKLSEFLAKSFKTYL